MLHFAGGWWEAESFVELSGSIAVESGNMRYIQPQDNGLFTLGESHEIGKLLNYPFPFDFIRWSCHLCKLTHSLGGILFCFE